MPQRLIQLMRAICVILPAAVIAAPVLAASLPDEQVPGTRIAVDPARLPPPYATDSPGNSPDEISLPASPPFRVPKGFTVNAFATGLEHARWMTVAPNGDVFLAEPQAGRVTLLRDADGDGKAELVETFAAGFRRPHGLAIQGNFLYVADTEAVWRLPWKAGQTKAEGEKQRVTPKGAIGSGSGHSSRNIIFNRDGSRFYVAIGSSGNIDREPSPRATVQSFAADGSDQKTYASGLRNPVGISLYPGTDDVYVVVNERDGLGDDLVPDYLTKLKPGGFYGWPDAYIGQHKQPDFDSRPDQIAKSIVPDLLFQSHSAPLGLAFYEAKQFPERYRGGAFVALHGSWNRNKPTGYKVVFVPFKNGKTEGFYETFLSGFWQQGENTAEVWGRPVGIAVAADGSLLVADDVANTVWRVSYRQ